MTFLNYQDEILLPIRKVEGRTGRKKSWIYKEMAAGRFPSQIKTGRCSVWIKSEIDGWIRQQIELNRGAA